MTRDDYGLALASVVAKRTGLAGAVVLDAQDYIVATSAPPQGDIHPDTLVANRAFAKSDPVYCTVYLTSRPCGSCKRLLESMRFQRVVVAESTVDWNRQLTRRESQILPLLAQGMSNEQVGKQLFISVDTVKTLTQRMRRRMGAKNAAHAVAIALSDNLIEPVESRR